MGLHAVLLTVVIACAGSTPTGSGGPASPRATQAPTSAPTSTPASPASVADLTARLEDVRTTVGAPGAIAVLDVGGTGPSSAPARPIRTAIR